MPYPIFGMRRSALFGNQRAVCRGLFSLFPSFAGFVDGEAGRAEGELGSREGGSRAGVFQILCGVKRQENVFPGDDGGERTTRRERGGAGISGPTQQIDRRVFLPVWGIHGENRLLLLFNLHESNTEQFRLFMRTYGRFSPEFRERAVHWVLEHQHKHGSRWAAVVVLASEIGCSPVTLRSWVHRAERATGDHAGLTRDERARFEALERENRRLRRENKFLREASTHEQSDEGPPGEASSETVLVPRGTIR